MSDARDVVVATVMDPLERPWLDAAATGRFRSVHADTVHEAIRAVRERPVSAVLLSPRRVRTCELGGVSSLIKGFPGVPAVAQRVGRLDRPAIEF